MNGRNSKDGFSGMRRRDFIAASAGAALFFGGGGASGRAGGGGSAPGPIEFPPLPYPENALEPVVSAKTIGFHYGKHHRGYVDNLNKLTAASEFAGQPLDKIIAETTGETGKAAFFNNASQAWNHTFYWKSLRPNGGGAPPAEILKRIETDLGGFEAFKKELAAAATSQFGSGWAWLVLAGEKLKIVKTPNAETPTTKGMKPLLTIDVWEHAYYLDYQNRRADYVNAVIDKLLNWEFALRNMG